jgi:hypothetical protein
LVPSLGFSFWELFGLILIFAAPGSVSEELTPPVGLLNPDGTLIELLFHNIGPFQNRRRSHLCDLNNKVKI